MFVLAALMKTVNICKSTAKIGTFVIHLLSVRGNSEALRTALIRWKRQQMFSHCFLFQLSKLQLDASNIMCGFLHFKASELLGLWQGKFCPQILASTAFLLQPKCWEWKQDATGGSGTDDTMAHCSPWSYLGRAGSTFTSAAQRSLSLFIIPQSWHFRRSRFF